MSILLVLVPARPRHPALASAPLANAEYAWARSDDGETIAEEGRSAPALFPRADSVVAVLSDADVAWHRVTLPKAPAAKMRAALIGVLEETLLDDIDDVHLALAPKAVAGQPVWVAAVQKRWLAARLAAFESARVFVDRVVPSSWPDEPPRGHFHGAGEAEAGGDLSLTWAHPQGVVSLRLQGTLARALLPADAVSGARFTATPSAAAGAESWLGMPVEVLSEALRALRATHSAWNLRQFDLAPSARGARAFAGWLARWRSPPWRPVRFGLAALVLVNLVGLNVWAWRQDAAIDSRREQMSELLRSTFPQVRAVLDAPLQMQRELDLLRASAGRPADSDLEPMLSAAAAAWPEGRSAVDTLRYEPGVLTLSAAGWSDDQIEQFRAALQRGGWRVEARDGRIAVSRPSGRGAT